MIAISIFLLAAAIAIGASNIADAIRESNSVKVEEDEDEDEENENA